MSVAVGRVRYVRFEIEEGLEPRELRLVVEDAHGATNEGVPRHAHVPRRDKLQEFGDELFGPYRLTIYQQRGRYVDLEEKKKLNRIFNNTIA